MLRVVERPERHVTLHVPPSRRAIVSWNAVAEAGALALIVHRADRTVSEPLLYVRWSADERRSLDGADALTKIAVDVLESTVPFTAVTVTSTVDCDAVAVAVPTGGAAVRARESTPSLDVPKLSQYLAAHPDERGWCSAAALAMLLRFHGVRADVASVARGVYDAAYRGTGNWAFNAAYAGAHGLRAAVAFLRGTDHVAAFLDAGLPVAVSLAWEERELPNAPLPRSDGHLVVVRGVDRERVFVNDPAQPDVATRYERATFDALFRRHGGIAYVLAPRERTGDLVALANGAELLRR
ncbi:MAG TPA: C39 family peptidase [Candidatus Baltobacteraceae bacterium]|nr:C39 family peptidase [Candidatus Baltobacteraceae bacterium]